MNAPTGKRTARLSLTLNKRNVDVLEPADKPYIAWDDKLMGFGIRVQPSGLKSFLVNYRGGDGGRKAPNKRVVIARYGRVAPDQARRLARKMLGKVADGEDPAGARASARRFSTLREAFHDLDPSRKSGGALHRLHCLCLEFDGACEVQRRVPTDWIIEPIDVSGHGSFSLAS